MAFLTDQYVDRFDIARKQLLTILEAYAIQAEDSKQEDEKPRT
jgi:hypothetical protein